MSSPSSGIAHLVGFCAWSEEEKLCNSVPVEIVLQYQIGTKVSTPRPIKCSLSRDSGDPNGAISDSKRNNRGSRNNNKNRMEILTA